MAVDLGGQLIFGVTDAGEIPGIEDVDESMRVIDDLAYQQCEPPITVIQETDSEFILTIPRALHLFTDSPTTGITR